MLNLHSATWYTIVLLYTAVLKLGELQSLGQTFYGYSWEYPEQILPGEQGAKVTHLQYMLSVISQFNSAVQEPPVNGVFGDTTTQAVTTFQRAYSLSTCDFRNCSVPDQFLIFLK